MGKNLNILECLPSGCRGGARWGPEKELNVRIIMMMMMIKVHKRGLYFRFG